MGVYGNRCRCIHSILTAVPLLVDEVAHYVYTAALELLSADDATREQYLEDSIVRLIEQSLEFDSFSQGIGLRQSAGFNSVPDEEDVLELTFFAISGLLVLGSPEICTAGRGCETAP